MGALYAKPRLTTATDSPTGRPAHSRTQRKTTTPTATDNRKVVTTGESDKILSICYAVSTETA